MSTSNLNEAQRQAVYTTEGPVLIIAGPGSGKTHTLVERIVHLVVDRCVDPRRILVSTFTEKAAAELVTRVSNRLADLGQRIDIDEMYIGTLHSICLRLLDENRERTRLKVNYRVWDRFDQQYTLYLKLMLFSDVPGAEEVIGEPTSGRWQRAERLAHWLNVVSEELLDTSALKNSSRVGVAALGEMYERYGQVIDEENALDFSMIQVEAYRLIRDNPDVLASLQETIQYVMIDEYQDTNTVQESILLLLSGPGRNICVVGDDDQSLYRFRGATVRNILEFPDRFGKGHCTRIALTTNYRSHPDIIRFYNDWMTRTPWRFGSANFRFDKTIEPRLGEFPEGPTVVRVASDAGVDSWCEEVHRFLRSMQAKGNVTDWNQIAFLFRSVKNRNVVALANYLEEHGISVYSPRSSLFFDRTEVRLMIGALISVFPQVAEMFEDRIREGGSDDMWTYYEECLGLFMDVLERPGNVSLAEWWHRHATAHYPLKEATSYTFSRLFYELLGFEVFSRYLGDDARGGVIDSRPARNLAQISQILGRFEYLHNISGLKPEHLEADLRRLFRDYIRFMRDGGIEEFEDPEEIAPSGCLPFLTIHQSKGLEFPVVVIGSLWSRPQKGHTELDEYLQHNHYSKPPFEPFEAIKNFDFWRLFYTGFSRARNLLVLTASEHAGTWSEPSKVFKAAYDAVPSWRRVQKSLFDLAIDETRSVSLKHRYAFTSHIAFFENCSRQYQFFRDLEFAPVREGNVLFGTLIHQTIEEIHKAALRDQADSISSEQIDIWFADTYRHLSKSMRTYLNRPALTSAREQVRRYASRHAGQWDRIREAEVDVSLVKADYILSGVVDLIRGEGGTVEIVDFKSEKKPDVNAPEDQPKLLRYRRQLDVYAHIIRERHGLDVSRVHLYYTGAMEGNPYISWHVDPARIDDTISVIDGIVDRIERREYSLSTRPKDQCKRCDFLHHCDSIDRK